MSEQAIPARSGSAKGAKKPAADSKPGIFKRIINFFRQVLLELKKVVYPTRSEMGTYFAVVLVFVSFIMAFVFVIDLLFEWLVKLIFGA